MATQIGAVVKGILFIGFSIQIILGIVWMCCNFMRIQDFAAPDTTLYGGLFRLLGEVAPLMYVLQLAAAFAAGYFFLQSLLPVNVPFAVWRTLALVTFPFAMQCHLALQPHSFVGTLFLMVFAFVIRGMRRKRDWCFGIICLVLLVGMTGVADRDNREALQEKGFAGALACRLSWSTLLNDVAYWPEELREIASEKYDVYFDAMISPENMEMWLDAIRESVGKEKAREYYELMLKTSLDNRLPIIVRQIGWDVLGYTFSPILVQMQMDGEGYDSYTGRNYENMRREFPVLTGFYVDYSCWWFALVLALCVVGSVVSLAERHLGKKVAVAAKARKRFCLGKGRIMACIVLATVWVAVLTLRGAGMLDYKWAIAVNQLWLVWALCLMNEKQERTVSM